MRRKTIWKRRDKDTRIFNEDGVALATVLVLSLICLAIIMTLVYLVTQGTKFSGFYKRYESAREAAVGGTEIAAAVVKNRGNLVIPPGLFAVGTYSSNYIVNLTQSCDCGDPLVFTDTTPDTCICRKLCNPTYKLDGTYNWGSGCTDSLDPTTDPDILKFTLSGYGTNYEVYAKIVDTTLGNSDLSGQDLGGACVSCAGSAIPVPPTPYLYRIEVTAQDSRYSLTDSPLKERGRLSVLYAY